MKKYSYGWKDWCKHGENLGWSDVYTNGEDQAFDVLL